MSPGCTIGEDERTYHDHRQKNTDGAKYGLGWCRTRDLLRKVHSLDSRIQQGESALPTFLLFGTFCVHGRRSWWLREKGEAHSLCGKTRALVLLAQTRGHFIVIRLIPKEPFDEGKAVFVVVTFEQAAIGFSVRSTGHRRSFSILTALPPYLSLYIVQPSKHKRCEKSEWLAGTVDDIWCSPVLLPG